MPANLEKARELFLHAVGQLPPEQWDDYVATACAGDAELEQQLRRYLQVHRDAGSFLESPAPGLVTVDEPVSEGPGTVIGACKLLEQIGEGGFGVVFMAEQTQPVRRKVALKILKPGMDTRQVVARFEAERQALAIMDHPNIAKVYDGGVTPSGRPYFVMELVRGLPITDFCDQNHLTPPERLKLFVSSCDAVQHAHQKGIIHRDLKPSNVLVAVQDGRPLVKIIDFGVAKALGQELTDKTLFTGFAQMIGTPLYMSPEQAGLSLDIDTRSDIYSLGVVLYELLTGSTPFTKKRFQQVAYDEIRRIIREEEPPKPSTRLSESKDSLASISASRHTEPAKLTKQIRGELDWIVMKALEKDRNRRYETANGLAMDLNRYLHDETVQACPPSAWYRFRKFARRNRRMLLSAALVAGALVAATIVLAISNVRVREERDQKEQALRDKAAALKGAEANFRRARAAVDRSFTLISESELFETAGLEPVRKQLLEGALQYYKEFVEQEPEDPELQAELAAAYFRIRQIYRSMNRHADSLAALRAGLDICERLRRLHPGNTKVLDTLASIRYTQLRFGGGLHAQYDATKSEIEEAKNILEHSAAFWESLIAEHPEIADFRGSFVGFFGALTLPPQALFCP
jgi:tetratricopeptide (TPR) repeat protein